MWLILISPLDIYFSIKLPVGNDNQYLKAVYKSKSI